MSSIEGNLVAPQDLFSSSATAGTDIGAYAQTGDGRGFRYCLVGATALVPGKLQQASAEDTSNYQDMAASAAAIGATSITLTSSETIVANALSGGLLTTTTGTGVGYTYKISGNTGVSSATGCVITLEDPLIVATDTTTRFDAIKNPYSGVVVNPTTATSAAIGVAIYPVNAGSYGWVQTHGPVGILADGTVLVGKLVGPSLTTAGAVLDGGGTYAVVGTALTGVATTQYGFVNLTID